MTIAEIAAGSDSPKLTATKPSTMIGKFIPAANQMKNCETGFPCRSESGMASTP